MAVRSGRPGRVQAVARRVKSLPAWPALLPFSGYVLWWVLGIGDFIWIIAGMVMLVSWLGVRNIRLPHEMVLWLLFCSWVVASLVMNDTPGRFVGAVYRLLLYLAAGIFAIHVYNARGAMPVARISRAMTWFLGGMTGCGYLALAFPEMRIHTPMSWLIPSSLQRNPLVSDMVVRHLTQWKADAWVAQSVRPVAPFLYANTWGNVYSLVFPFALIYLWWNWKTRRRPWLILLIVASLPPALSTLNRGMFIGLAVVGAWVIVQSVRRGFFGPAIKLGAVAGAAITLWYFSSFGEKFFSRIEETNSTGDRKDLYRSTYEQAMYSPLFGYGSPRPAEYPWLPSLGTQGQLWTVMYSHGFIGLGLFMGFLVALWVRAINRTDPVGAILGGIILATIVETFYYGMMTGIMVTMVAAGLLLRDDSRVSSADRPGRSGQKSSTIRRPSRRLRSSTSAALQLGYRR